MQNAPDISNKKINVIINNDCNQPDNSLLSS